MTRVAAISSTTVVDRRGVGDDAAGARHVADGAEAHRRGERLLAVHALDEVGARRRASRRA